MMPIHWVCFPSATLAKANDSVRAWRAMGYHTLVYQDIGSEPCNADLVLSGVFPGYYRIINTLAREALCRGAYVVTCASDDMRPDPAVNAERIADMYLKRFPGGLGVLQACGDPQGKDATGTPAAARICGSPTFGEGWSRRAYGGRGGLWDGFHSFWADEHLWNVAKKLNKLWLNPDLTIDHLHWSYRRAKREDYHKRAQTHWDSDKALFLKHKKEGFPGSDLLVFSGEGVTDAAQTKIQVQA